MNALKRIAAPAALVLVLGLACANVARAEDAKPPEKKLGWADTGELSYVLTAGNSESRTLGLKDTARYVWTNAVLELNGGAIRAQSTTTTYEAQGTPTAWWINTNKDTQVTAEYYYLNGRYDRNITERFFWYVGAGWDRNTPAGIQNRYVAAGGVGNIWIDTDLVKWRTDYAISYTNEDDIVDNPDISDSYVGLRLSTDYLRKFGQSTVYTFNFMFNDSFSDMSNWRGNMTNAVAVTMTKRLALKVSLQWLYSNEPALIGVPLDYNNKTYQVYQEADKLDTIFTTGLVVNF